MKKVNHKLKEGYSSTFNKKRSRRTIKIEPDNKCPACIWGEACQWVDEEDPRPVDSLASFEAFVRHGGKFGREALAAATSKASSKRKGQPKRGPQGNKKKA